MLGDLQTGMIGRCNISINKTTSKGWKDYKEKLKQNIEKAIERDNVDKEILEIMLSMSEYSKLIYKKNNVTVLPPKTN